LHPSLSTNTIHEGTSEPVFVRLPEIDLDKCVSFQQRCKDVDFTAEDDGFSEDLELNELHEKQHGIAFTEGLPFWRLLILTDPAKPKCFSAVFVYHHALGDGASGMAFLRTFTRALQDSLNQTVVDEKSLVIPPNAPLLPTLEESLPMPISLGYLLKEVFKAYIWKRVDNQSWTGSFVKAPLENKMRHLTLSKALTTRLRATARENGSTVTATSLALFADVLFSVIPTNFTRLLCCGPINVRGWCGSTLTEDSMGVWFTEFSQMYERSDFGTKDFPWNEAGRTRQKIKDSINLRGKNSTVGLLKYVSDYQKGLFLSKLGKPRDMSVGFSNLGAYQSSKSNDQSDVRLGRMLFSQSAGVTAPALTISSITGPDGRLVLSFNWQDGVLEEDLVIRVIEKLKQRLLELFAK
jgi:hypothetical protein